MNVPKFLDGTKWANAKVESLTGDASATDPACSLAPKHSVVEAAVRESNAGPSDKRATGGSSFVQLQQENAALWSYRTNPE